MIITPLIPSYLLSAKRSHARSTAIGESSPMLSSERKTLAFPLVSGMKDEQFVESLDQCLNMRRLEDLLVAARNVADGKIGYRLFPAHFSIKAVVVRFLPGIVIPASQTIHFYEAVLAGLVILVWHFFFVILVVFVVR